MGELPPLHTPQGPGVPRALRPGFPPGRLLSDLMLRLLASLSPFVALRFLPLPCVRFSPLRSSSLSRGVSPPFAFSASFPFFPLPCVRFSPVLSTSFLTPLPGSFSSPFHAYLLGIVPLPRFWFSPLPVRFRFSSASSPLPPVSFPFLPLPFVQFSPVLLHSRPLRSPAVFPPTRRSDSSPVPLPVPGIRRPSFGARFLWPAGRAEAPPHHSTGAARATGQVRTLKPYFILPS